MSQSVFSRNWITDYPFHIISNTIYTLFGFVYAPEESHFVVSSYIDPLSGVFFLFGFSWGLKRFFKDKFSFFITIALFIQIILLGPSREHAWTSVTHMFQLMPWLCFYCALGVQWFIELVLPKNKPKEVSDIRINNVILLILIVNMFMAFSLSPEHSDRYYSLESLSLRFFRQVEHFGISEDAEYLFLTIPEWDIQGIQQIQTVYATPPERQQLQRSPIYTIGEPHLTDYDTSEWAAFSDIFPPSNPETGNESAPIEAERKIFERLTNPSVMVFVDPKLPVDSIAAIEGILQNMGRIPCEMKGSPTHESWGTFWITPDWQGVCPLNGIWPKFW